MGIAYFGLGNFLGGMSEGFQQMAKIQQEKDRLALEQQAIDQRSLALTQNAEQFAAAQGQQQQQFDVSAGLQLQEMAQRERLQYAAQMEAERAEGRARLERNKPSLNDAIARSYVEDLIRNNPDADWAKRLGALLPPMLGQPVAPTGGGTAMEGMSPYFNFYKGGILGGSGQ